MGHTSMMRACLCCSSQAEGCNYIQALKAGAQERMQRYISGKKFARPDKVRVRVEALVG